MEIPDHLTFIWETCIWVKKQQLELDLEQLTGSKLGKEYNEAVYCHPAYLTYMQSASCAGWITSWSQDCLEKYQQPQVGRWHQSNGRKWREVKSFLMRVKEEREKVNWNSTLEKLRSSLHGKYKRKMWKHWQTLFSRDPKSLQTLTAAKKVKDACSLERKLWQM